MFQSIYYIKPEAMIICKICNTPNRVSAKEFALSLDELKSLTASDMIEELDNRKKLDGWHHNYCPRCTEINAARIAEEELDEQI
jgi:hypothetical protein